MTDFQADVHREEQLRARIAQQELTIAAQINRERDWAARIAHLESTRDTALNLYHEERVKAEQLTAENQRLRADSERLDWLDANGALVTYCRTRETWIHVSGSHPFDIHHEDLRTAIDAARGVK